MSAPYRSARDYATSQALPAEPAPLLREYRVGLVVPMCGLNPAQLAEVNRLLKVIAGTLPEDGRLHVSVPAYDHRREDGGIPAEVLNLGRKHKVAFAVLPERHHRGGAAERAVAALADCDEVWCCPEVTHVRASRARVNVVYQLGLRGPRPARYKLIPPWVEAPPTPEPKAKKEKRLW